MRNLSAITALADSDVEASSHIISMPRWLAPLGVAKFALAFIILVFVAAATGIWGGFKAFGLALFTASTTLIIAIYYIISLTHQPAWYNRWAVLGLEFCATMFWLASFAMLAQLTRASDCAGLWDGRFFGSVCGNSGSSGGGVEVSKRGMNKYHAGVALAGTAAGLGGVEFLLFAITLTVFAINLHRHWKAGHPSLYGDPWKAVGETEMTPTAYTQSHGMSKTPLTKESEAVV